MNINIDRCTDCVWYDDDTYRCCKTGAAVNEDNVYDICEHYDSSDSF